MKQELIQAFIMKHGECFDMYRVNEIQTTLANADDSKAAPILGLSLQNPTVILIIAIVLGWDRFFIGDIGLGIVKVITCYGCGIWWLVDIFTAKRRTQDYNYKKFQEALMLAR